MSSSDATTSVPACSMTAAGFVAPSEPDILAGVQADINAALGGNVNPALNTPQGQLATSETAIIGDCNDQLLALFNGFDPRNAIGRQQDALGYIYFMKRNAGEGRAAFEARREATVVRAIQCAQQTSDPVVAMIAGPVTMDLSGTFSQSGSFSVSASSALPVFGLQADASRTKGQTMNVQVQFVPLSALADAEAGREVGYAGALLGQNDVVRQGVAARIEAGRSALAAHVEVLISYVPRCLEATMRPFVGVKKK